MIYLRALQQIGAKTGDPILAKKDRAVVEFNKAVSALMPDASQEDIPGYYTLKTDLDFSVIPYDAKVLQMLRVKSIHLTPGTAVSATVTYLSKEEIANMAGIDSLQPTENDVFIYRVGNLLYPIVHASSVITIASQVFHMLYIKDFQSDTRIADDYELSDNAAYMFSSSFVRKVIDLAVSNILNKGGATE